MASLTLSLACSFRLPREPLLDGVNRLAHVGAGALDLRAGALDLRTRGPTFVDGRTASNAATERRVGAEGRLDPLGSVNHVHQRVRVPATLGERVAPYLVWSFAHC